MHVVVVASQKGGAGKSTLCANVAVSLETNGEGPVVLVDTDPQGTLTDWWNAREASTPALTTVRTLTELPARLAALKDAGVKFVVIDTPPSATKSIASVASQANLVLIPVRPSPNDLRAVGQTIDIATEAKKPFLFCITQAKPAAKLTAQTIAALSAYGEVVPALIGDRVDFASSMVDGRTVIEFAPKGKSAKEIKDLCFFVKKRINELTKKFGKVFLS